MTDGFWVDLQKHHVAGEIVPFVKKQRVGWGQQLACPVSGVVGSWRGLDTVENIVGRTL